MKMRRMRRGSLGSFWSWAMIRGTSAIGQDTTRTWRTTKFTALHEIARYASPSSTRYLFADFD